MFNIAYLFCFVNNIYSPSCSSVASSPFSKKSSLCSFCNCNNSNVLIMFLLSKLCFVLYTYYYTHILMNVYCQNVSKLLFRFCAFFMMASRCFRQIWISFVYNCSVRIIFVFHLAVINTIIVIRKHCLYFSVYSVDI